MFFLELKLNAKEETTNERTHLLILIKFIKKKFEKIGILKMRQNEQGNKRKQIDSYNKKLFRIRNKLL